MPPQAVLRLELDASDRLDDVLEHIRTRLTRLGYTDYGRYASQSSALDPTDSLARTIELWQHREYMSFEDRDVVIFITPYSDASKGHCDFVGTCPDGIDEQVQFPLLNVVFQEGYPGGFTPDGLAQYEQLKAVLREVDGRLTEVAAPPPNDREEYERVHWSWAGASIFWWLAGWAIGLMFVGGVAVNAMWLYGFKQRSRRIAFVVCSLLVALLICHTEIYVAVGAVLVSIGLGSFLALIFVNDPDSPAWPKRGAG